MKTPLGLRKIQPKPLCPGEPSAEPSVWAQMNPSGGGSHLQIILILMALSTRRLVGTKNLRTCIIIATWSILLSANNTWFLSLQIIQQPTVQESWAMEFWGNEKNTWPQLDLPMTPEGGKMACRNSQNLEQSKKMCGSVSCFDWHMWQKGSGITCCRHDLWRVRNLSWITNQAKIRIRGKVCKAQSRCQG